MEIQEYSNQNLPTHREQGGKNIRNDKNAIIRLLTHLIVGMAEPNRL